MVSRIWQTMADVLYWIQLGWIVCGFLLMGYLAFRIFPYEAEEDSHKKHKPATSPDLKRPKRDWFLAGNYRLEEFPELPAQQAAMLPFRSTEHRSTK